MTMTTTELHLSRHATTTMLLATAMAITCALPSSTSAQEACSGPFVSYDAAVNQCLYLNSIGYCLPPPEGYTIIRNDDLGYLYCCCIALVSIQPDGDEIASVED